MLRFTMVGFSCLSSRDECGEKQHSMTSSNYGLICWQQKGIQVSVRK